MSHGHDLDHIGSMIYTFLDYGLKGLHRRGAIKIMIRPDKDRTVFMSCLTHPLGHLLLRFEFDIHIARSSLYCPDQPAFCKLHRLDLTTLSGHSRILERRFIAHDLSYTACRHQRDIESEYIL